MPIRVIQWTTGNVGRRALRAILRNPAFDAELCGHERATGVRATDDVDGIATHATLPLVTARAFASAGG